MATISVIPSRKLVTVDLNVWENSTNTANNTSNIGWSLVVRRGSKNWDTSWVGWGTAIYASIYIEGSGSQTIYIPRYNYGGYNLPGSTFASGSFDIDHNPDGKKSISFSLSFTDNADGNNDGSYYTPGDASTVSGSLTLTIIPRYFSSTPSLSLSSREETKMIYSWSTSETCDSISWEGGGSASITGTPGTSGKITVTGLSANSSYTHKGSFRRQDSQLTSYSNSSTNSTYNYPYITGLSASSLSIGNSQTVYLYNPLSRSCAITTSVSGTSAGSASTSGTSVSFTPNATTLYSKIPSATQGSITYTVTYSSQARTYSGTFFTTESNCKPTFSTSAPITYQDTNSAISAITTNNQHIVQNQSNLQVTIAAASAKNSASISKYVIKVGTLSKEVSSAGNIDFGKVNLSSDTDITVYAVDTRGYLTTTYSKTITVFPWSAPKITINELARVNDYEETTYLTATLIYSSVNNKNTGSMSYSTTPSTTSGTLPSGERITLTFDQNQSYTINIVVSDLFTSFSHTEIVGIGVPIMNINTSKLGVGINCMASGKGLYVNDHRVPIITKGTAEPSGGSDGDIYIRYS